MIFRCRFFKDATQENVQIEILNFKHSMRYRGEATAAVINSSVNSGHARAGAEDEIICYWKGKLNKLNKIDLLHPVHFKGW